VLDQLLVQLEHHLAGVPALLQRHVVLVGQRDDALSGVPASTVCPTASLTSPCSVAFRQGCSRSISPPCPSGTTVRPVRAAASSTISRVEVGDGVVVAVRLVELEHRELGECVESTPSLRKMRPISKTRSTPPTTSRLR
jgi:hypothetical protein